MKKVPQFVRFESLCNNHRYILDISRADLRAFIDTHGPLVVEVMSAIFFRTDEPNCHQRDAMQEQLIHAVYELDL